MNRSNFHFAIAAVAITILGISTPAEARRSQRSGFNFGTTLRLLSNDDRTFAGEGSDKDTHAQSSSQLINPYLGYSFGSFNLGLTFAAETRTTTSVETSDDGAIEVTRKNDMSGKGGSVFIRFLFGDVFFFEAAGGLYQEKINVSTETKNNAAGSSYTGEQDKYQVEGTGPGYHLGAGLELPMGERFFFTSSYQIRIMQMRDLEGKASLGRKRSFTQKREVLFGLAYYHR